MLWVLKPRLIEMIRFRTNGMKMIHMIIYTLVRSNVFVYIDDLRSGVTLCKVQYIQSTLLVMLALDNFSFLKEGLPS